MILSEMSGTERWNCLRFQEVVAAKAEFFKMFKEAAEAAAASPESAPESATEAAPEAESDAVEVMSAPVEYTPVSTDSKNWAHNSIPIISPNIAMYIHRERWLYGVCIHYILSNILYHYIFVIYFMLLYIIVHSLFINYIFIVYLLRYVTD